MKLTSGTRAELRPALRSPLKVWPGAASLDPVAVTYAAAVAAAGGTMNAAQKTAVSNFISGRKAAGTWNKILEMGLFRSWGTLAAAAVKVKYPVVATCVLNGFNLADLTAKGLAGDGVKWVNTQTTVNQVTSDGAMGMAVFVSEEITTAAFSMMMGTNAGGNPQVTLRWLGDGWVDSHLGGIGATTASFFNQRRIMPVGLVHTQRVGTNISGYKGGISTVFNGSGFAYAGSTTQIGVFSGDGGSLATPMTSAGYMLLDGTVTDADALDIAKGWNVLMAALGVIVPSNKKLRYVPIIGQSLAVGATGTPVLSTTQPYNNLMADSGTAGGNVASPVPDYFNAFGQGCQPGALAKMIEMNQETLSSGCANTIGLMARAAGVGDALDIITHNVGVGATAYAGLKKGTNPYNNSIAVAEAFKSPAPLYASLGLSAAFGLSVFGESNAADGTYGLMMREWQADYQTDLFAVTGESGIFPIFHTQSSSWSSVNNINSATAAAPFALTEEYKTNPLLTVLVGPKYHYGYAPDGVHLNNVDYRALGENHGKIIIQHFGIPGVTAAIPWVPLMIDTIQRVGAVITVRLKGSWLDNFGGVAVTDTVSVTDPSPNNTLGWEWSDSATGTGARYTAIASVTFDGVRTYTITLVADPSGNTNRRLRYAYTGTVGNSGGPTTGPRGCIRDNDSRVGPSGTALYNRLIHLDEVCP